MVAASLEEARKQLQNNVILAIDNFTLPTIIELMDKQKHPNIVAIVAGNGGIGSHIARVGTRVGERMPIIFGASLAGFSQGEIITVNGDTGEVFRGKIPRTEKNGGRILTRKEMEIADQWYKERLRNPWRFVTAEEGISQYVQVGKEAYIYAKKEFQSPRAHVQAVINALIPEEILINYTIAKLDETERMRALMVNILSYLT